MARGLSWRGPSAWGGGGTASGGNAPADGPYVLTAVDGDLPNGTLIGAIILPPDLFANRPSAAGLVAGTIFMATDTVNLYRADGAGSWDDGLLAGTYTDDAIADLRVISAGNRWTPDTSTPGFLYGNVVLSAGISGGDTLVGGSGSGENLTLGSTANSTRGVINLRDRTLLITEDKTFSAATGPSLLEISSARTITLSSATNTANAVRAFDFSPTVVFGASAALSASYLFANVATWKSDTTSRSVLAMQSFYANPTVRADTGTLTITTLGGVTVGGTLDRINSGTLAVTSYAGYSSTLTVSAGATLTDLTHYTVFDVSNTGTVTSQTGFSIPALSGATTNTGFTNTSTTVFPAGTSTMSAASSTVRTDRTHVRLNNTSGGALVLTGTPTIPDGQQGQIIYMINTSANSITFQDETTLANSNLRLGALTRVVNQYGTLTVMFNSTTGVWHEIGFYQ